MTHMVAWEKKCLKTQLHDESDVFPVGLLLFLPLPLTSKATINTTKSHLGAAIFLIYFIRSFFFFLSFFSFY